jgi:hypothetical protein
VETLAELPFIGDQVVCLSLPAGAADPPPARDPVAELSRDRDLQSKFPAKWNREIIVPDQGIKSADQGSFSRIREDRGVRANLPERATERAFERARVIWPLFADPSGRRIDPGSAIQPADRKEINRISPPVSATSHQSGQPLNIFNGCRRTRTSLEGVLSSSR